MSEGQVLKLSISYYLLHEQVKSSLTYDASMYS